jgi:DNA-binding NtrC family response regulator
MQGSVLVVDDDEDSGAVLCDLLLSHANHAVAVASGEAALQKLEERDFDVVVSDLRMDGMSGLDLCREVRVKHPDVPVIVVTGYADIETAVAALRAGAWDYVTKPFKGDHVAAAVARAVEHRRTRSEVRRLQRALAATVPIKKIIGQSPQLRAMTDLVNRVADGDATVLVTGESGTGKELVAQALHDISGRKNEPFVAVNCSAIPANLLESELFGHVKGAFTDARNDRQGLFVQAGRGTMFLDEIGEMPLDMQVKLLRVLQQRTLRPVGGDSESPVHARVICATNRDLETEVEEGRFREDLFYRVNVVTIEVPPLRARGSDIQMLAEHFLKRIAARTQKNLSSIAPEALQKLRDYDWPGNVRELENSMERAVAMARLPEIQVADLPNKVRDHQSTRLVIEGDDPTDLVTLSEIEERYVRRVVEICGGNKSQAAKVLGIDRRSLYRRLGKSA